MGRIPKDIGVFQKSGSVLAWGSVINGEQSGLSERKGPSMFQGKTVLALIPARGGSKGLPRKNVRDLAGKPLLAWSIEAALKCPFLDTIVVSTEDQDIAEAAKRYGAEAPFIRPMGLATDSAKSIDVILHAINWFEERGRHFDLILLLQPTSPLRTVEDINGALDFFSKTNADAVVSVCECEHSPLWMNKLPPDFCMKDFIQKAAVANRQDLEKYYRLNGALYLAKVRYLKENQGFFGDTTYAYIMSNDRSVDIDSESDLEYAAFILSKYNNSR